MIRRHPFFIFIFVVTFLVCSLMLFLQSKQFASFLKVVVARAVPGDLGMIGNFSDFSVKIYPPGISINKPKITFAEKNLAKIPEGSQIIAERIDLVFRPLQMFSRNIRVKEIVIHKGSAEFPISKKYLENFKEEFKKGKLGKNKLEQIQLISWEELLRVRADSILFEETQIVFNFPDSANSKTELQAKEFRVSQWTSSKGVPGYELIFDSENTKIQLPNELLGAVRLPEKLDRMYARITSNSQQTEITDLNLTVSGVRAKLKGILNGDIFDINSSSSINAEYQLDGELGDISTWLKISQGNLNGQVAMKGKFSGKLEKFPEKITAEYKLVSGETHLSGWSFSKVEMEGKIYTKNSIPQLEVKSIELLEPSIQKSKFLKNENTPIGSLSVGSFTVPLGGKREAIRVNAEVKLDNTHLHWFTGPVTKNIFPLSLRASGNSSIDFNLKDGDWIARFKSNLLIQNLVLDNQKLLENKNKKLDEAKKKYFEILSVPEVSAVGEFSITKLKFETEQVQLKTPKGLVLAKGSVDFDKGFNLSANGHLDLADISALAESKLNGVGDVSVRVTGGFDDVKLAFYLDVKNSEFLGLQFGNLLGNIDVLVESSHILIKNVKAEKQATAYTVNGLVDTSDANKISLRAEIARGRIQDVHAVIDSLISPLWWYPRSIGGDVTGIVDITGGLGIRDLKVSADLQGSNWDYFGERFKTVKIVGNYDKGVYRIEELRARKVFGAITGSLKFEPSESKEGNELDGQIEWKLLGDGLSFQDIDLLARLDFPNRGKLFFESTGKGKISEVESISQFATTDIYLRGQPFRSGDFVAQTKSGKFLIKGNLFGALVDGNYDYWKKGLSQLNVTLTNFDFSPLILILNPLLIEDSELKGLVSAELNLRFNAGKIEYSDGLLKLEKFLLKNSNSFVKLDQRVESNVVAGKFILNSINLIGSGSSHLIMSLEGDSGDLRGKADGALDLQLLQFLSPIIKKSEGQAIVLAELQGKLKQPQAYGKIQISKGKLIIKGLDSPFENINGSILLKNGLLSIESLESELGDGRVTAGGSVNLFLNRWPEIHLVGNLQGNKIKIYPFSVLKVRGKILIDGDDIPYQVTGNILLDSALSTEKFGSSGNASISQSMSQSMNYLPPVSRLKRSQDSLFKLDIGFSADKNLIIRNDLLDAEFKANGKIINSIEMPNISGNAHLVQGRLLFKDREFQLQSIEVEFDNPNKIDPKFSLSSFTDVSGTRIQLSVSGRPDKYKLELTSHPSLPESEIFSLLALGYTNEDVKKLTTEEQALIQQSEAASLMLHSTDFNRDLKNKTGLQVEIDESINREKATSAFGQSAETETAGTKIVIKRQIGKKLDVSVGSTVGGSNASHQEVGAEYKLSPGVSVMGVWDTSVNSGPESRDGYGIDIKLQKRFK